MHNTPLPNIPRLEYQKPKILKLSLKAKPFEVMVSGEKTEEYRTPSDWILSRLYNKDGTEKEYDFIEFINGYGSQRPAFLCDYKGFYVLSHGIHKDLYSNGLSLGFLPSGTVVIKLGKIISTKNINSD